MNVQTSVQKLLRATSTNETVSNGLRILSSRGLLWDGIWRRLPVERSFQVELGHHDSIVYSSVVDDAIGRSLFWRGLDAWEGETLRVFYELSNSAPPASLVIDIGANTGVYSLLACRANPNVEVLAFEPVPKICERLSENVSLNGYSSRCTIFNMALSDYVGEGGFHVPAGNLPSSASFHEDGFRGVKGTRIVVPVTRLDEVIDPKRHVELIKVDVEGFEDRVLHGACRVLSESRPRLVIECSPDGPLEAVEAVLRDHDYLFYHLLPNGPLLKDRIEPDPAERYRNYLMVPAERAFY